MNYNLKHRNSGESSSIVEIIRSETTVSSLLEIVACEVTNMAKKTLSPLIALLIAAALISALLLNTWQAFRLTSDLTRSSGRYHLESISGELSATIGDAERLAMRLAIQAQPYVWDKVALEEFIHERKKEVLAQGKGCFNVYMAGSGWAIIPDFNMPDDYIATEREWYKGAMRAQGDTYVTAPYVDAMTGDICYSVSVMLGDRNTVLALDYTMDNIQSHILHMYENGSQYALIVTGDGIIAGCSDQSLVGRLLSEALPEYASIYSLVRSRRGFVNTRIQSGFLHENLFATASGFGWYLIVSEDDWELLKDAYVQLIGSAVIALMLSIIMVVFYLVTLRRQRAARQQMRDRDRALTRLAGQLMEPINAILDMDDGASAPSEPLSQDKLARLHTAGRQIINMMKEAEKRYAADRAEQKRSATDQSLKMNKRFRTRILMMLVVVVAISVASNVWISLRWGNEKIRREVENFDYTLSEWVSQQKSILDMFCSVVSTNPEMLSDYDGTVAWLNRITQQYPEISVTYMTNPEMSPTVYMNNGWLPPSGWRVEERQWYIDTMASESGWAISAPYYDEQTGLYCVTLSKRVYNDENGAFLGVFGIDFFIDKLTAILGGSYTENGYAFLADSDGAIINHPHAAYQMTGSNAVNVSELPYGEVKANGQSAITIRDYDGTLRIITAKRNHSSRFTVYEAVSFYSIFLPAILSELAILAVLVACAVMVYRLLTALMRWQDDMNARMQAAADTAIAAGKAKSRFLAQMSHEIRTPINAVLGMNEMILRESSDPAIQDYASNIQTAGKTLLALINSILDFSKIEEGKMEIIPVKYDTTSVINNLVASISERAKAKKLELIVDVDPNLPAGMVGDDVRLSQVIMNLLTNAVKYTEAGHVRLSIQGGARENGKIELEVSVEDTGIGIRQEDLSRLFESFERLDEVRNHSIEGTGLGMSIVTRLLDMMGSRLDVKSVYGQGSTFSFKLTQTIADETPIGDYSRRLDDSRRIVSGERLRAEGARVLVVDDNDMNLKVAKNLLKLFGIQPDLADSGFAAIELIRKKQYHVVFLDHMMPNMDGIETLQLLKKEQLLSGDTKTIVLTANAVIGAKEQYLEAGFDDYLSKPIDVSKLENLLIRTLPKSLYTLQSPEEAAAQTPPRESTGIDALHEAGFDTDAALRYAAGDRDFYLELAASFAAGAAQNLPQIRKDFVTRDWADYQIRVHALKSTARQIGANALSDLALGQEMAAKNRSIPEIESGVEPLLQKYEQTAQQLKDLLGLTEAAPAPADAAQPASSGEELRDQLSEAQSCISNFETERALEILKPCAGRTFDDPGIPERLNRIVEALENFDNFTAETELNELIGILSK